MGISEDISSWRVLIVDDEPDNLNLVAELLQFSGAEVHRAENGQQALDLFEQRQPNLVLLDLAMPDLDGWEVHRQLRARPEANDIPIVALTALAMPDDIERIKAAGFDAYVTKPFRMKGLMEELFACIRKFSPKSATEEPRNA